MTTHYQQSAMSLPLGTPDAHGEAALLLVESLIHALIERSVLSTAQAVEIIDIAADASLEIADQRGEAPLLIQPYSLIGYIAHGLRGGPRE
jgi:hypothetical protein